MELLPCPFCGKKAILRLKNLIYCEDIVNCGCQIETECDENNTKEELIKLWNRRYIDGLK